MNYQCIRYFWLSVTGVMLVATGCGNGSVDGRPTPVSVSGTVYYKKQPSVGAKVMFAPQGHQYAAVGQTDSVGRFHLQTFEPMDGAVPGEFKIAVTKFEVIDLPNGGIKENFFLPGKYRDPSTSGLTAVVPPEGTKDIRLELAD